MMTNTLLLKPLQIKLKNKYIELTIENRIFLICNLELIEYKEDQDYRKYQCSIQNVNTSIVINCGIEPPYIQFENIGRYDINHDIQEYVIGEFSKVLE